MAKLFTYVILMLGLLMLLKLGGFIQVSSILDTYGLGDITQDMGSSGFFASLIVVLGLASAVSAIVIGYFTKSSSEYTFLAGFAVGSLFILVPAFVQVYSIATGFSDWIKYPVWVVFSILGVGYGYAVFDWVFNRGNN